jgi:hypothetical protein
MNISSGLTRTTQRPVLLGSGLIQGFGCLKRWSGGSLLHLNRPEDVGLIIVEVHDRE